VPSDTIVLDNQSTLQDLSKISIPLFLHTKFSLTNL